jgi:hypothetical protein
MQCIMTALRLNIKVGGPASSIKELTDRRVEQLNWIVAAQTSDGSLQHPSHSMEKSLSVPQWRVDSVLLISSEGPVTPPAVMIYLW